jgi:hypothetical protein
MVFKLQLQTKPCCRSFIDSVVSLIRGARNVTLKDIREQKEKPPRNACLAHPVVSVWRTLLCLFNPLLKEEFNISHYIL